MMTMENTFSPVILLGGTGMILVALGFLAYAIVRRLGWKYLIFGALLWFGTVAVKFALAIPFNSTVYRTLTGGAKEGIGVLVFDLYVGTLTGLTEVLIVFLVLRYSRWGKVEWNRALAFGIGFGAFEALLLGIGSLTTMLVVMLAPQSLPAEALSQFRLAENVLFSIAPIVERFFTIWVHILSNVLLFYAVVIKQVRWFWLAFVYKSLIDAWAAWGQLAGMTATAEQVWVLEIVVILWGVIGWLGTRWVQARYPNVTPEVSHAVV
jgi:uncharacterized membrane protein YhfC